MSSTAYRLGQYRATVPTEPAELFPASIQEKLDRLEALVNNARQGELRPSAENLEWAKKVLLRVLPRYFLQGAEIDGFQREIHVNWEHNNKRVTAFLPSPNQLKIYCERTTETGETEHHLRPEVNDPWVLSGVLRWLFQ